MSKLSLADSVFQKCNPCPFCGSKEGLRIDLARAGNTAQAAADIAKITCTRCHVVMEAYAEEVLQERWNRRSGT